MTKLIWEKINNNACLTEKERIIAEKYTVKKSIDLDTGKTSSDGGELEIYKAIFTVNGIDSDYICLDFGIINHIMKIDFYLNEKCIAESNCAGTELKVIVPSTDLKNENCLLVIVKEGCSRDIWLKDIGLKHYVPEDVGTVAEELPQILEFYSASSETNIISVQEGKDCLWIQYEEEKNICLRFYEKGILRMTVNRDDSRMVEEYCVEQLEENVRKSKDYHYQLCGDTLIVTGCFGKIKIKGKTICCYNSSGKELLNMQMLNFENNFSASAVKLVEDEAIFALGENGTNGLNKRGCREDIWVCHDYEKCDVPVPFYISSRKYGFYLNSSYHSVFDMGKTVEDTALISAMENTYDVFYFAPNNIREIISVFSDITGKIMMPPKWAFGFWQAGVHVLARKDVENALELFEENNIPVDVICIDPVWQTDYCDLNWNDERFPDHKSFIEDLKERNLHLILWTAPFVNNTCNIFEEGRQKNAFVGDAESSYKDVVWWKGYEAGLLDYMTKENGEWWASKISALLNEGVDGFKIDGGDGAEIPCTLQTITGKSAREFHNLYPLAYARAIQSIIGRNKPNMRAVTWERTGFTGSGKYPCTWGGDQFADFTGTRTLIKAGQLCGLVGVPFWSQDVGGFCLSEHTTEEFFIRSYQWGMLAPLSRAHGQKVAPWSYSQKACDIVGEYIRMRYNLIPYLYSLGYQSYKEAAPIMYPLFVDWLDDRNTYLLEYQYMLGPSIMVAPIYEESQTESLKAKRNVYFPEGKWYDYFELTMINGGCEKEIEVEIEKLPLYYKEGAIVPKKTGYRHADEYSMNDLEILIIESETSTRFVIYDDDGVSLNYQKNVYDSICIQQQIKNGVLYIEVETLNNQYKSEQKLHWQFKVLSKGKGVYIDHFKIDAKNENELLVFDMEYQMGQKTVVEIY